MSSRSKGVTYWVLSSWMTACVRRSPSVSSALTSAQATVASGNPRKSASALRAVSSAFAPAWEKSVKNSLGFGTRASRIVCSLSWASGAHILPDRRGRHTMAAPHGGLSVAGAGARVREAAARHRDEAPVIAGGVQRQLQDPVGAGVANLAVRGHRRDRSVVGAARAGDELADPVGVGRPARRLRGEALVDVVVPVE